MTNQIVVEKNDSAKILGYGDLGRLIYLEQYNSELYIEVGKYQLDFTIEDGELKLTELRT